ncbi:MAG: hypothetical protein KIT22_00655, partial [Verrucomicrobiae bacterium]|nr:hypothetical protein [Verrucomicrobiae bacterium]
MALKRRRLTPLVAGPAKALFYELPDSKAESSSIFAYQTQLEHILGCADHLSVHHYEIDEKGRSQPVWNGSIKGNEAHFCQKLHQQTLDFVKRHMRLIEIFREEAVCRKSLARIADS